MGLAAATATTRTLSPTSRPRTPTPTRGSTPHADLAEASSTRSRRGPRRPTRRAGPQGPWWYVSRTEEGRAYAIHCRGADPETATEHVLIDENRAADGHDFFELGEFEVSPGQGLLAWSVDVDGHEEFTLRIRDLDHRRRPARRARAHLLRHARGRPTSATSSTWCPTHAMRPYQVWRHELGTAQADDALVYEEPDEHFNLDGRADPQRAYIVIHRSQTPRPR